MKTVGMGTGHKVTDREKMEALETEVTELAKENRELREKMEAFETANKKVK